MRVPLHFGAGLFGFFHPPQEVPRRCAVILCGPIGVDFTRSDRVYRHLAEQLAAAGFPVLRFDPRGCGDSAGDVHDPDLVRAWLDDLKTARDELLQRSGATEVAFIGLRLAATVATIAAAEQGGVASLVLWNPCPSGRQFHSEIVKLHALYGRMEPSFTFGGSVPFGDHEALGLAIPAALGAALDALDLFAVEKRPAAHALVIDGGNFPARDRLLQHLAALGTDTICQPHPGQKFLLTVSHRATLPDGVLAAIVAWLDRNHPERQETPPTGTRASEVVAESAGRPIEFGDAHPLFGILALPVAGERRASRPAVILANAGTVNRAGPHRLYVALERRLVQRGFAVLRMDLAGIGDSPASGAVENLCYPPSAVADVQQAMEHLAREKIAERFVIAGLCSGGDIAFQSGLRDRRVAGAVIMNPRTFCVLDLQSVESASGEPPSATVESVPRALRQMVESGVETLLLVSERDPGVRYVDAHFGDEMAALPSLPHFSRVDLPGADHTFTALWAQARVIDLVEQQLVGRHG